MVDRQVAAPLQEELEDLRRRLTAAEEALRAIRSGEVDAVLDSSPDQGMLYARTGSEDTYRTLIERMYEGAATLAADGLVLYCNRRLAELLGDRLDRVIGQRLGTFLDAPGQARLAQLLAAAAGRPITGEVAVRRPGGAETFLQVALSPLPQDQGARLALVASDLTERKRVEAQQHRQAEDLREANRELESFNRLMVGRELRIIELKQEVNALCRELGRDPPYRADLGEPTEGAPP